MDKITITKQEYFKLEKQANARFQVKVGYSSPSSVLADIQIGSSSSESGNATVPVPKGYYWRVERVSGTILPSIFWIPMGS